MTRPGVDVVSRAEAAPPLVPTDTGVAFLIGPTQEGVGEQVALCHSLTEFLQKCGERQYAPLTYDAAETYFREGGYKLYVSSLAAPPPPVVPATGATAGAPGTWEPPGAVPPATAADLAAGIPNPVVANPATLWTTGQYVATADAAQSYWNGTAWVAGVALMADPASLAALSRDELNARAEEAGVENPAGMANKDAVIEAILAATPEAAPRAGGTPFAASTELQTALDALNKDLGPGQVFLADPAVAAVLDNQVALLTHCKENNRVALLSTQAVTAAELAAAAEQLHVDAEHARYGALFGPDYIIPGVTPGTTRTVPATAVVAGIISRNDVTMNPNEAAAGVRGRSLFAIDLAATFTDAEYTSMNEAGINMGRKVYGMIENYGYRSCADPETQAKEWLEFGNCRLNMGISAKADVIGETYVFKQLDGRRRTINDFGSELSSMLVPYYESGALYGRTAQQAFDVNVGPSVNTDETIAAGELHAIISVRMSHMSEWVVIEIVKVATTQVLASASEAELAA